MKRTIIALCLMAAVQISGCVDPRPPQSLPPQATTPPPLHPPASASAEYALRWSTTNTTPDTAADELKNVIAALQRSTGPMATAPASETFTVAYFDVDAWAWPDGYDASLRKRQKIGKENFEVNYKVRGKAPLPANFTAVDACKGLKQEQETDIAIALKPEHNVKKASVNCEAKSKDGIPEALAPPPQARLCAISMTRYTLDWPNAPSSGKKELKVEYWTFKPPATDKETRALIEVSWKASSADDDEQAFRKALAPLLQKSPEKLQEIPPAGKEQTALACDANWPVVK